MKHTLSVTAVLVTFFLIIQVFGLYTIQRYDSTIINEQGAIEVVHQDTVFGEQPEIQDKSYSFLPVILMILIGTVIILLLIRYKMGSMWKFGFVAAVFFAMAVTLGVYVNFSIAVIIAILFAWLKVFRPNIFVHNLTEILIYPGITIVLIPILNTISVIILLLLISVYDFYAVRQSKHMIKLAEFQTNSKAFAGLFIPYKANQIMKSQKVKAEKTQVKKDDTGKTAILGGGDIAFPLIFSAVVYEGFLMNGYLPGKAFLITSIIILTSTLALTYLFIRSEKGRYYPAMPYITVGCLIGYGITLLF